MPAAISSKEAPQYQLRDLMHKAGVCEDVILRYTGERDQGNKGCVSVADFAGLYKECNFEDKIETEIQKMVKCKEDDLEISRTRIAWSIARSEVQKALRKRSEGTSITDDLDWDTPLRLDEETKRLSEFDSTYQEMKYESEDSS